MGKKKGWIRTSRSGRPISYELRSGILLRCLKSLPRQTNLAIFRETEPQVSATHAETLPTLGAWRHHHAPSTVASPTCVSWPHIPAPGIAPFRSNTSAREGRGESTQVVLCSCTPQLPVPFAPATPSLCLYTHIIARLILRVFFLMNEYKGHCRPPVDHGRLQKMWGKVFLSQAHVHAASIVEFTSKDSWHDTLTDNQLSLNQCC